MMDHQEGFGRRFFQVGTPQCGFLFAMVGVVIALMLIFLGFWNTLVTVLFALIGYALGAFTNKTVAIKSYINKIFPPKGE